MNFFKNHADAATVIGVILTFMIWMRSDLKNEMSEMRQEFKTEIVQLGKDIYQIDTRLTRIETILFMHNMYPKDLAAVEKKDNPGNI